MKFAGPIPPHKPIVQTITRHHIVDTSVPVVEPKCSNLRVDGINVRFNESEFHVFKNDLRKCQLSGHRDFESVF